MHLLAAGLGPRLPTRHVQAHGSYRTNTGKVILALSISAGDPDPSHCQRLVYNINCNRYVSTERGESMKWPMAALALLSFRSAALAEVCDKAVGESWYPSHGPVWLLNPLGFPFGLSALVTGLVMIAALRRPWLAYAGSMMLALYLASIAFADLIPEHEIYLAQIREGCRAYRTDLLDVGIVFVFAAMYLWIGRRIGRSRPGVARF